MKLFSKGVSNDSKSELYFLNGSVAPHNTAHFLIPSTIAENYAASYRLRLRPPLNVFSNPGSQIITTLPFFAIDGITGIQNVILEILPRI